MHLGRFQDTLKIYVMDSLGEAGGCDMWFQLEEALNNDYEVWHSTHSRKCFWSPEAHWSKTGNFNWQDWIPRWLIDAEEQVAINNSKANGKGLKRSRPYSSNRSSSGQQSHA